MRVKDSDKLPISGDCDLAVENDVINLYKPGQSEYCVCVCVCVCVDGDDGKLE